MAEIDFDELIRRIRQIPERAGNRAGRRALRRGANVIRDAARNNARSIDDPESRNKIWRNIIVQGGGRRRERGAGGPMMRVGVRGGARNMGSYGEFKGQGKGNPGGDTWYWRLIEFGFTHRSGTHVAPVPFMRNAMNDSAAAALAAVAADLPQQIDKEIEKIIK